MKFHKLAPAGNKIQFTNSYEIPEQLEFIFPGWSSYYYGSGAMALAASLLAVKKAYSCKKPEVILPAYTCPEVISSIIYAGIKPVLVDFVKNKPWICIDSLQSKITNNTIAVIGVDFLGIQERHNEIKKITTKRAITYIEDSAQYFPKHVKEDSWGGDIVIISFGRGKPISLLGGGVVLINNDEQVKYKFIIRQERSFINDQQLRIKIYLYNRLINPELYWLIASIPILRLGETRFIALEKIEAMNYLAKCNLKSNISAYQKLYNNSKAIRNIILQCHSDSIFDIPSECIAQFNHLTRYPVLLSNPDQTMFLYEKLSSLGLGPSLLYKYILPKIEGLKKFLKSDESFPNAEEFSSRLITLPTHLMITEGDLLELKKVIQSL